MSSNALIKLPPEVTNDPSMVPVLSRATMFIQSGFFKDVKSVSQAATKLILGQAMGLDPLAALSHLHIIEGKPTLSAQYQAAIAARKGFRIKLVSEGPDGTIVAVIKDGEELGRTGFSLEDAKAADLLRKQNWQRYRSDMFWARAVSRAIRRYAPDVFGGTPVYDPDELGAVTDNEGNIIDVHPTSATTVVEEATVVEEEQTEEAKVETKTRAPLAVGLIKKTGEVEKDGVPYYWLNVDGKKYWTDSISVYEAAIDYVGRRTPVHFEYDDSGVAPVITKWDVTE